MLKVNNKDTRTTPAGNSSFPVLFKVDIHTIFGKKIICKSFLVFPGA